MPQSNLWKYHSDKQGYLLVLDGGLIAKSMIDKLPLLSVLETGD